MTFGCYWGFGVSGEVVKYLHFGFQARTCTDATHSWLYLNNTAAINVVKLFAVILIHLSVERGHKNATFLISIPGVCRWAKNKHLAKIFQGKPTTIVLFLCKPTLAKRNLS